MSEYTEQQRKFLKLKALLILYADAKGIFLVETEGCVLKQRKASDGTTYEDAVHMRNSLHYSRMATDFMIYKDGEPLMTGNESEWHMLGLFWESLNPDCRWGGRFGDSNHFSVTWGGRA